MTFSILLAIYIGLAVSDMLFLQGDIAPPSLSSIIPARVSLYYAGPFLRTSSVQPNCLEISPPPPLDLMPPFFH